MSTEDIIKVVLFVGVIASRVIAAWSAHERKRSQPISKRKKLKALKAMAARGYSRRYYTDHPLQTFENRIHKYYWAMKQKDYRLSHFAEVFLEKIAMEDKLFEELAAFIHRKSDHARFFLQAVDFWYEQKAIRPIEEWTPDPGVTFYKNQLQLLAFLFERYPVPRMVASIWNGFSYNDHQHRLFNKLKGVRENRKMESALFNLYFHLAEGYNIRNWMPETYRPSKKEAFIWMNKPAAETLSIEQAFWRSVYLAKGGRHFPQFVLTAAFSFEQLPFWRQFISLIVAEEEKGGTTDPSMIAEMTHLLQWLKFGENTQFMDLSSMEKTRSSMAGFSLKRETLHSVYRKMFGCIGAAYPAPAGFKDAYVFTSDEGKLYQIRRLKNRVELSEEGRALNICLGEWGYHLEAIKGNSHFWSLRLMEILPIGQSLVAIEVVNNEIVEYQAYDNSRPEEAHLRILWQWAEENELAMYDYIEDL